MKASRARLQTFGVQECYIIAITNTARTSKAQ